uniref:NADH-cytochrome b5 reductase n=1 Tax=Syphacia muris TaxID=451379 RepID=A0A0N5AX66_9BILA
MVTLVNPEAKYSLVLLNKRQICLDTVILRFGLPSESHVLGLSVGQHVNIIAQIGGKLTIRSYTPISPENAKGFVDLLVKVYRANENPKFPLGGKMTQYLDSLNVGDRVDFRGPLGLIVYKGHGNFEVRKGVRDRAVKKHYKKIGMLAGGSGITPMWQIIKAVLSNDTDDTSISLLFANQSEDEILLRDELDELANTYPRKFKVWYTVDQASPDWSYSTGFINAQMIEDHLPSAGNDVAVLMCGPPPMINFACLPSLDKLNYPPENRLIF